MAISALFFNPAPDHAHVLSYIRKDPTAFYVDGEGDAPGAVMVYPTEYICVAGNGPGRNRHRLLSGAQRQATSKDSLPGRGHFQNRPGYKGRGKIDGVNRAVDGLKPPFNPMGRFLLTLIFWRRAKRKLVLLVERGAEHPNVDANFKEK